MQLTTARDLNIFHVDWWSRIFYDHEAQPHAKAALTTILRERPGASRVTSVINATHPKEKTR